MYILLHICLIVTCTFQSIPSTLMERTDSTTAMLSLVGYAGESDKSEDEDDDDVGSSAVDNISDEDADNSRPPSRAPDNSQVEDENSSSSIPDSRKPPIVPRRQNLKGQFIFVFSWLISWIGI